TNTRVPASAVPSTSRLFPRFADRNNRELGAFGPVSHQLRGYFHHRELDITAILTGTALKGASGNLSASERRRTGHRLGAKPSRSITASATGPTSLLRPRPARVTVGVTRTMTAIKGSAANLRREPSSPRRADPGGDCHRRERATWRTTGTTAVTGPTTTRRTPRSRPRTPRIHRTHPAHRTHPVHRIRTAPRNPRTCRPSPNPRSMTPISRAVPRTRIRTSPVARTTRV